MKILKSLRSKFKISNHRQFFNLSLFSPLQYERIYIGPNSTILGEVVIENESYVGNNTIIKGDMNLVDIACHVEIGDNCVINTVHKIIESDRVAKVLIR